MCSEEGGNVILGNRNLYIRLAATYGRVIIDVSTTRAGICFYIFVKLLGAAGGCRWRGDGHGSDRAEEAPARSRRAGRRPDLTHACQPRTSSHRRKDVNSSGRCILTFSLMGLVALMNHKVRSFREGAAGAWVRRAFAQGEAYVSAEPERERGHGVSDSVPDAAHALASPTGLPATHQPKAHRPGITINGFPPTDRRNDKLVTEENRVNELNDK